MCITVCTYITKTLICEYDYKLVINVSLASYQYNLAPCAFGAMNYKNRTFTFPRTDGSWTTNMSTTRKFVTPKNLLK